MFKFILSYAFSAFCSLLALVRNVILAHGWYSKPPALPSRARTRVLLCCPLLTLPHLALLLDGTAELLLTFKAVFQLVLCQSQSLLQDGNSLQGGGQDNQRSLTWTLMPLSAEQTRVRAGMPTLSPGSWFRHGPQNLLCFWALPQGKALSSSVKKR